MQGINLHFPHMIHFSHIPEFNKRHFQSLHPIIIRNYFTIYFISFWNKL